MVFLELIVMFDYVSCVQAILEDLNVPVNNLKLFHLLAQFFLQILPFFLLLRSIVVVIQLQFFAFHCWLVI